MKTKVYYIEAEYLEDYFEKEEYIDTDEYGNVEYDDVCKSEMFVFSEVNIVPGNYVIVGGGAINFATNVKLISEIDEFAKIMREKREEYEACEVFHGTVKEAICGEIKELGSADVIEFEFLKSDEPKEPIDISGLAAAFMFGGLN